LIYFKPDSALLLDESNNASPLREIPDVADGENSRMLSGRESRSQATFLGRADKQNAAFVRCLEFGNPFYDDFPATDAVSFDGRIENRPEGILSQDAQGERVRVRAAIAFPADELTEIVKVGGFDFGFGGMRLLRGRRAREE
jgi:hypothetical protein